MLYPGADMGMWCCMSWCYVPESCATGRGSTIWPGRYWSRLPWILKLVWSVDHPKEPDPLTLCPKGMDHCQMDTEVVSSCAYDTCLHPYSAHAATFGFL